MKPRVLLICGDTALCRQANECLIAAGFAASDVPSAAALEKEIADSQPDLLIVDDAPPSIDGYYICRTTRLFFDTPIIMLGGSNHVEASIRALASGADLYLARKSLNQRHLVARARALVRRASGDWAGAVFAWT